jgi:hypothetical protein
MLNPAQAKRLADLEKESVRISFERTKYSFASDPKGSAEWDRLWTERIVLEKEIEQLRALNTVRTVFPTIPLEI